MYRDGLFCMSTRGGSVGIDTEGFNYCKISEGFGCSLTVLQQAFKVLKDREKVYV